MDSDLCSDTPQSRRGARKRTYKYKAYKTSKNKIPRTTLLTWKRRANAVTSESETDPENSSFSSIESSESFRQSNDRFCENSASSLDDSGKTSSSESEESGSENDSESVFSDICDTTQNLSDLSQDSVNNSDSEESMSDSDDFSQNSLQSVCRSLYTGCEMSVDMTVYKLMKIFLDNRLSKKTLKDFLDLLIAILPPEHSLPHSEYYLFKYIRELAPPFLSSRYYYCSNCILLVGTEVPVGECSCCKGKSYNFFIYISLADQLKFLFEKRNLAEILEKSALTARQHDVDVISDITDGSEYLRVKCSLKGIYDLILTENTDGIELASSSTTTLWPGMCTIAEVPPQCRKQFVIVFGTWHDCKKPKMNTFLQPFCLEVKEFFEKGIEWTHPRTGLKCTTRITAPLFVADAPARADVLNCEHHMSKYGCNLCTQKSTVVVMPNDKKRRFFVFQEERSKLRTDQDMKKEGNQAINKNKSVKGVKGPSIVSILPLLDRSTCVLPESLHSLCLGVVRMVMFFWLTKPGPWNVSQYTSQINDFLLNNVKPTDDMSRLPRSVLHIAKWKGSEFLYWLLFYSVPIMEMILKKEYFQHWLLLVISIELLSQENVSANELDLADQLLRLFLRDIGTLYSQAAYIQHAPVGTLHSMCEKMGTHLGNSCLFL